MIVLFSPVARIQVRNDKGLGGGGSNKDEKDVTSSEDSSEVELIDLTSQWLRRMEFTIPSWWMVMALSKRGMQ